MCTVVPKHGNHRTYVLTLRNNRVLVSPTSQVILSGKILRVDVHYHGYRDFQRPVALEWEFILPYWQTNIYTPEDSPRGNISTKQKSENCKKKKESKRLRDPQSLSITPFLRM